MKHSEGMKHIRSIRMRWISSSMLSSIFLAISFSLLSISLWNILSPVSYWFILPISLLISLGLIQIFRILKISEADVSRLLDQTYPQLEESFSLVLKNPEKLNILEKLQIEKIKNELQRIQTPTLIYKRLKISAIFLIISILVSIFISRLDFGTFRRKLQAKCTQLKTDRSDLIISSLPLTDHFSFDTCRPPME